MENKTIGERIANLRKERNIQQDEFADRIGVSRQTLSQWETDKQMPRADKIREICTQFGVSANYFYDDGKEETFEDIAVRPQTAELAERAERAEPTPAPSRTKKITLEKVYDLWRLARGWFLTLCALAVLLAIFIIEISPNINGTTVRLWAVDWTAMTVILFFVVAVLLAAQIIRTILWLRKRKEKKDEEK